MLPERDAGLARLPDGGQLAYALTGAGPPLLLHRPLGGSMALWGEFGDTLARHFRVIAFDPRGVGRSSDVPPGHGTRAMAADALALLDVLDVARAHVFGLSLGGMVACWQAIDAPARVDRLVLASTLPDARALSPAALARGLGLLRCFLEHGVEAELCLVRRIVSPGFPATHPRRWAAIEGAIRRVPAQRTNLRRLASAAARHRARSALQRVSAETLLLFGALDPFVQRHSREDLLHDFPRARLEIIDGAGHDLSLEAPEATADHLIHFLNRPAPV